MTGRTDRDATLLDGRFQLGRLLGHGGMADVYAAMDLRHGRQVAIKILRGDIVDSIGVERFRREIALTGAFTHPHILPLLESGDAVGADGRRILYYAMPLIEGESLRDLLAREDHLALPDAVRITREVLEALRYAHEAGVIHRDIKPANILLSDRHAVVADFGIARPVAGPPEGADESVTLSVSGVAIGTPAYMSPEQAFGGRMVDGRCDLYATGCVLYEMLTGRPPFEASTGQAVMARKMTGMFVPPSAMRPGLPAVLDDIVASALRPDAADRYPSATAFLAALDVLGDPSLTGSGMARMVAPPRRRRRTVAAAITVVAAALGGVWMASSGWFSAGAPGNASPAADPARVAVLPFENLSADTSLAYVANGLTTDLIDELAQVRSLTVVSKNGVLPFAGKPVGVDSISRALRVGSVITGDVRRSGDRVTVSVRLVDGPTGHQIASHDTTASPRELLGVQSAVLEDVSRFLRLRLGEQVRVVRSRRRARSPEAWELVERVRALRAGELAGAYTMPRAERTRRFAHADSLMERAAALDRAWPEPLVERALLALALGGAELVAEPSGPGGTDDGPAAARRTWDGGVRLSDDALARDTGDARALLVRGRLRSRLWAASTGEGGDSLRILAERDLRAAVDRRPDLAEAWESLSSLLYNAGDFAEAERAAGEALRADEYLANAPLVLIRLQEAALAAGHVESAKRWCAEGQRRYPQDVRFTGCELVTLAWTGSRRADVGRAWAVIAHAERSDTNGVASRSGWATRRLFVAAIAARAGMVDSASAILAAVRAALPDSAAAVAARAQAGLPRGATQVNADYAEAIVCAALGRRDEAIRLLAAYLGRVPSLRRQTARMSWFTSLQADPRFAAITSTR